MDSTMQDADLLVSDLFEHGRLVHPNAVVTHYRGGKSSNLTFSGLSDQTARLAGALGDLGVTRDDVVATLCWNVPAHLAAYFAVPSIGAILHTLNLRLSDEQLVYIVNHAADRVVIVNGDLVPQLARILPRCPSVRDVIVVGEADGSLGKGAVRTHDYDALLTSADPMTEWPRLPERSAAVLCYTTGTTGDPKGVAYSHRSIYLHTLAISSGSAFGFNDADRVLPIVPMFHANAWGWPYAAWANGADLIMTDRFLQAEHLAAIIGEQRPTAAAAVPTLWSALDSYGCKHGVDYSSLRLAVSGGSALSPALAESFAAHHGVRLTQGWGMTETSPLLTFSRPPTDIPAEHDTAYRTRAGRIVPGVRARVVDGQGAQLSWDGASVGEVELRGATITGGYFRADPAATGDKFRDGWLRTGDLGVIHPSGWIELKDRLKDGIKSGGEWISSIELENAVSTHPAVAEAVAVGVPDSHWEERPLVCVKVREGVTVTPEELRAHLVGRLAKWWLPERWAFVTDIPKTSVGKLDKKRVRADYDADKLTVMRIDAASRS